METEVQVRCPLGPRKLFMKMRLDGESPVIVSGNLMEFSCRDCARYERMHDASVKTVLHRYDLMGDLIESEVVHS